MMALSPPPSSSSVFVVFVAFVAFVAFVVAVCVLLLIVVVVVVVAAATTAATATAAAATTTAAAAASAAIDVGCSRVLRQPLLQLLLVAVDGQTICSKRLPQIVVRHGFRRRRPR